MQKEISESYFLILWRSINSFFWISNCIYKKNLEHDISLTHTNDFRWRSIKIIRWRQAFILKTAHSRRNFFTPEKHLVSNLTMNMTESDNHTRHGGGVLVMRKFLWRCHCGRKWNKFFRSKCQTLAKLRSFGCGCREKFSLLLTVVFRIAQIGILWGGDSLSRPLVLRAISTYSVQLTISRKNWLFYWHPNLGF